MVDYINFLPKRLSQLRYRYKVSAREMSLALGQNCSYINRIENGLAMPSAQKFFDICEYLKITPEEFFSTSEDPRTADEIYEKIIKLSAEQMTSVLQIIDSLLKLKKQ